MKARYYLVVPTIVGLVAALIQPVQAERWPSLEDFVSDAVLVVKARQVGEFTTKETGSLSFEVLESWKGKFDPQEFTDISPKGYIQAAPGEHGVNVVAGQEIVFYFSRHNQPVEGKLTRHNTAFPINNGKIVYGSTANPSAPGTPALRQEMTVYEFKQLFTAAKAPGNAEAAKEIANSGSERLLEIYDGRPAAPFPPEAISQSIDRIIDRRGNIELVLVENAEAGRLPANQRGVWVFMKGGTPVSVSTAPRDSDKQDSSGMTARALKKARSFLAEHFKSSDLIGQRHLAA